VKVCVPLLGLAIAVSAHADLSIPPVASRGGAPARMAAPPAQDDDAESPDPTRLSICPPVRHLRRSRPPRAPQRPLPHASRVPEPSRHAGKRRDSRRPTSAPGTIQRRFSGKIRHCGCPNLPLAFRYARLREPRLPEEGTWQPA
jgi:hypothetical protein